MRPDAVKGGVSLFHKERLKSETSAAPLPCYPKVPLVPPSTEPRTLHPPHTALVKRDWPVPVHMLRPCCMHIKLALVRP